eukprot:m.200352 g.200352  ORF g.200352 m.200352 type:complete len:702 (+) comp39590_c0_seq1:155-2260(+)
MAELSTKAMPKTAENARSRFAPSYKLAGDAVQYTLPSRSALKPGVESQPGQLDSWPVHGIAAVTSSLSLGQVHRPRSINRRKPVEPSGAGVMQSAMPKPRFLSQLETYLEKELKILGCPLQGPDPLRLQVYREVFEYLMDDFKTYKPLMSAIKNEYDLVVKWQGEEIERLQPLQTTLKTVEEECERKIMSLRGEEKADIANLKKENRRLCKVIDVSNEEKLSLQALADKLSEELSVQYKQYRDEADSRKLLVSEINELRFQQQDSSKGQANSDEDPVLLKLMLNRAREDLKKCQQRLNEVLADYQDVVPRREFEELEVKANSLSEDFDKMKTDYKALMEEHSTLLGVHKEVLAQRDKYAKESEMMKRSSTPRPEWDRCADFVEGGAKKWQELTDGRTSDEIVDILVSQLTGKSLEEVQHEEYFEGQGTGDDVLKHLRYEGQVRNRRMAKKEVLQFIEEVWQERSQQRDAGGFGDFVFAHIQRRFTEPALVAEWGYSIHDACSRLGDRDQRIDLFGKILSGEMLEEVYHKQIERQGRLVEALKKSDEADKGRVTKDEFLSALSSVHPQKSKASLTALVQTAEEMETGTVGINYQCLFNETFSSLSAFLDLSRNQEKAERMELVVEMEEVLQGKSDITALELMEAIKAVDPVKDDLESKAVIAHLFGVAAGVEDLATIQMTIDVPSVVTHLQSGIFERSGLKS